MFYISCRFAHSDSVYMCAVMRVTAGTVCGQNKRRRAGRGQSRGVVVGANASSWMTNGEKIRERWREENDENIRKRWSRALKTQREGGGGGGDTNDRSCHWWIGRGSQFADCVSEAGTEGTALLKPGCRSDWLEPASWSEVVAQNGRHLCLIIFSTYKKHLTQHV